MPACPGRFSFLTRVIPDQGGYGHLHQVNIISICFSSNSRIFTQLIFDPETPLLIAHSRPRRTRNDRQGFFRRAYGIVHRMRPFLSNPYLHHLHALLSIIYIVARNLHREHTCGQGARRQRLGNTTQYQTLLLLNTLLSSLQTFQQVSTAGAPLERRHGPATVHQQTKCTPKDFYTPVNPKAGLSHRTAVAAPEALVLAQKRME